MKLIAIAAAAAALTMAGAANAQMARGAAMGGAYAEVGYTQLNVGGQGEDLKPGAIRGIVGLDFHPNAAVEAMVAFGVRDEEQSQSVVVPGFGVGTATAKVKLKQAYGFYLKPKGNVTDALELFGRVGYTHTKLGVNASVTVPGMGTVSMGDSGGDGGFSYGAGANFKFSPTTYIGVDYMRYYKKDGVEIDGLTVGVGFRF